MEGTEIDGATPKRRTKRKQAVRITFIIFRIILHMLSS